jgi:hypothetical protein
LFRASKCLYKFMTFKIMKISIEIYWLIVVATPKIG